MSKDTHTTHFFPTTILQPIFINKIRQWVLSGTQNLILLINKGYEIIVDKK